MCISILFLNKHLCFRRSYVMFQLKKHTFNLQTFCKNTDLVITVFADVKSLKTTSLKHLRFMYLHRFLKSITM
jgi:hypothetical protein